MFEKLGEFAQQMKLVQRLMKDEHFRALMGHPKVQELLRDPEFQELIKAQDMSKLAGHPKFASVMQDPEIAGLVAKLNPQMFQPDAG
jgi:hypothetical protein